MVWSKDQERKVYEFRSKLYGDTLNRWMENYPDPPSDRVFLYRLYGKKPFVTKKPAASYMEWGGGQTITSLAVLTDDFLITLFDDQGSPLLG